VVAEHRHAVAEDLRAGRPHERRQASIEQTEGFGSVLAPGAADAGEGIHGFAAWCRHLLQQNTDQFATWCSRGANAL
jgi:hypothetical protein